jgi:glycosyltransferase involved in cell wall biosynthesis
MERTLTTTQEASLGISPVSAVVTAPVEHAAPAISIIIPAYNVAPYIRETLESVFAQTFADYEVIVINDGSPDTEAFEGAIEPYRNRIRYIRQENGGASSARNAGLRAAQGKLVAFLDADDVWSHNYLEEQLQFIREQNCDLVCADAMIAGDSPDAGKTYMESVMETAPMFGEVTFLQLVSAERSLITSGVVARRDLILEVGLFDQTLRNAQDFDLWLRLARHGARLAYQRRVLLEYRARQGSLSGDAINSHQRELRVLDKIEQFYPLTPSERADVSTVIQKRRALIAYELGKLYLLPGDFPQARESFARASGSGVAGSWKPRVALWLTVVAPHMMQALCLRRMRSVAAKEPVQEEVLGI